MQRSSLRATPALLALSAVSVAAILASCGGGGGGTSVSDTADVRVKDGVRNLFIDLLRL